MKLTIERSTKSVKFTEVEPGVFIWHDGCSYIKTKYRPGDHHNVIRVRDGCHHQINNFDLVEVAEEAIIKYGN